MRTPVLMATACLLGATLLGAQPQSTPVLGPQAPPAPPTFELGKDGKRAHIDFTLKMQPISDPTMQFSRFAGHKTFIFYFSAKCPHCQHAFPFVQKIADSLVAKGVTSIAISIKDNSEEDIHSFAQEFNARMPIFQDADRSFSNAYGTGFVPELLLVNEKGEYICYTFDENVTSKWIMRDAAHMSKKK